MRDERWTKGKMPKKQQVTTVVFKTRAQVAVSRALSELVRDTDPPSLRALLRRGREACWVRAALPVGLQCRGGNLSYEPEVR